MSKGPQDVMYQPHLAMFLTVSMSSHLEPIMIFLEWTFFCHTFIIAIAFQVRDRSSNLWATTALLIIIPQHHYSSFFSWQASLCSFVCAIARESWKCQIICLILHFQYQLKEHVELFLNILFSISSVWDRYIIWATNYLWLLSQAYFLIS